MIIKKNFWYSAQTYNIWKLFKNEIIYLYLKTADHATENLSDVILEYIDNLIYEKDNRPNETYQKK